MSPSRHGCPVPRADPAPPLHAPQHPAPGTRHAARGTRHAARGLRAPRPPGTRHAAPGTRHPTPGTRHPAPGTRHPARGTRHAARGTRHPARGARHPARGARHAARGTRHAGYALPARPAPGTRHPAPGTRHPARGTRHAAPGTRHPARGTRHAAPGTRHPAPGTRRPARGTRHAARGTRHAARGTRHAAPGTRATLAARPAPPPPRQAASPFPRHRTKAPCPQPAPHIPTRPRPLGSGTTPHPGPANGHQPPKPPRPSCHPTSRARSRHSRHELALRGSRATFGHAVSAPRTSWAVSRGWHGLIALVVTASLAVPLTLIFTGRADANSGQTGEASASASACGGSSATSPSRATWSCSPLLRCRCGAHFGRPGLARGAAGRGPGDPHHRAGVRDRAGAPGAPHPEPPCPRPSASTTSPRGRPSRRGCCSGRARISWSTVAGAFVCPSRRSSTSSRRAPSPVPGRDRTGPRRSHPQRGAGRGARPDVRGAVQTRPHPDACPPGQRTHPHVNARSRIAIGAAGRLKR